MDHRYACSTRSTQHCNSCTGGLDLRSCQRVNPCLSLLQAAIAMMSCKREICTVRREYAWRRANEKGIDFLIATGRVAGAVGGHEGRIGRKTIDRRSRGIGCGKRHARVNNTMLGTCEMQGCLVRNHLLFPKSGPLPPSAGFLSVHPSTVRCFHSKTFLLPAMSRSRDSETTKGTAAVAAAAAAAALIVYLRR